MLLLQLYLQALRYHSAGVSGPSVSVHAIPTSQHLPEVFVPALPSRHDGGAPHFTPALTTAAPQPPRDASLFKDAEAKLSQACTELSVTRSQLQVVDLCKLLDLYATVQQSAHFFLHHIAIHTAPHALACIFPDAVQQLLMCLMYATSYSSMLRAHVCVGPFLEFHASLVQAVQQQLTQQASLHSAELSQTKAELQQAQSALASAQAHTCQLKVWHLQS